MADDNTQSAAQGARPRGPWDSVPETAPPTVSKGVQVGPLRVRVEKRPASPDSHGVLDKGQSPAWALLSTLLLGGFLWWMTGSLIVVVAALFGLLVHEYGHVLAMNRVGMGPARIYIIPFLGGLAKGQRPPATEWQGVLVSLAGPLFGLIAVAPLYGAWLATGNAEWLLGAFYVALINLVNLVPAAPLDGSHALGPVLARIHPMVERGALLVIGAVVVAWGVMTGRWILALFLGISLLAQVRHGAGRGGEQPLNWGEAGASFGLYLMAAILCVATAIGVLLPLSDGSALDAAQTGLQVLGVGRDEMR